MAGATRTRQWRAWCVLVFMAVASAGAAQSLIGKRVEVLQDSLQADLMGLAEVVQLETWDPANMIVPSLGLSDAVSWIRLKLDSRSENGQLIEIQLVADAFHHRHRLVTALLVGLRQQCRELVFRHFIQ